MENLEITKEQFIELWNGSCAFENHKYEDFENHNNIYSIILCKEDKKESELINDFFKKSSCKSFGCGVNFKKTLEDKMKFGDSITLQVEPNIDGFDSELSYKYIGRIMFNGFIQYKKIELTINEFNKMIELFDYTQAKFLKQKKDKIVERCEKKLKEILKPKEETGNIV